MTIRRIPCSKSVVIVVSGGMATTMIGPLFCFQNHNAVPGHIHKNNCRIQGFKQPIYRLKK